MVISLYMYKLSHYAIHLKSLFSAVCQLYFYKTEVGGWNQFFCNLLYDGQFSVTTEAQKKKFINTLGS